MSLHREATQTRRLLTALTGREQAVLCGRGAAGIWAVLRALGYANRKILLPANTCYIVLWAVLESGNMPVLVDVNPETANLDAAVLDRANTTDAAAVIPCHMYGLPAPIESITAWAKQRGIFVIEDAALVLGGQADGRPAGLWGDVGIFSFGLGKIADNQIGGALVTDDPLLAQEVSRVLETAPLWDDALLDLTNQWYKLYWALHQYEDRNPRLLNLYPALFDIYRRIVAYRLPQSEWTEVPKLLSNLESDRQHRLKLAAQYDRLLQGLPLHTLPRPDGSTIWRYPLLVAPEQRDELLAALWENGVHGATRWYPSLRYMTSALAPEITQPPTSNADLLGASIINLPVDHSVSEDYVIQAANTITEYFDAQES